MLTPMKSSTVARPPDAAVSTAVSADLSQTTERGASAAAGNAWEMNRIFSVSGEGVFFKAFPYGYIPKPR